jgi:hypothetical protein
MSALLSVCWAPRSANGEAICGGPVTWERKPVGWCSSCSRCGATGLAAVGQRTALDARTPGLGGVA